MTLIDPEPDLAGHDPARLMQAAISSGIGGNEVSPGPWEPPLPEELNPLMSGYEIVDVLGRGGMGAVYKGIQTNLDREVAIKLLPPELSQNPEFEARFKREAKSMAQLNHPNIVQIYDFGQTSEGHYFFVMEYVEGTDLHEFIRDGKLDSEGALNAISQICDALQYAHEKGFVHRDIKPANIFMNTAGILKVGDFGLAKLIDGNENASATEQMGLTMTGVAMGTPHYIAPEQMEEGTVIDHRADIYSLGVMFYQMLTGDLPRGAVKAPSEKTPKLDVRIDGVVFKAMDTNREVRYQTATDLRSELDIIRTTPIPAAEPEPVSSKKKSPALLVGIAVLAMLVVGGFLWLAMQEKTTPEAKPLVASASADGSTPPAKLKSTKVERGKGILPLDSKEKPTEEKENHPVDKPKSVKNAPEQSMAKMAMPQSELLTIPTLKPLLQNYLAARRTEVDGLATKYLRALDGNLNKAADAGDLNLAKAFQGEKKLVEALQKSLANPPADPVAAAAQSANLPELATDAPEGLSNLRKIWTGERQKISGKLSTGLQLSLKALEGKLTKARDFANAEKIQNYRKAITSNAPAAVAIKPSTEKPAASGNITMAVRTASKDKPFENSLGMKFVPVPIIGGPSDGQLVLFSIWETRVKDYEAFIKKNRDREWPKPDFKQKDDHPAVNVSWEDAVAFCEWLTETDRKKGKIGRNEQYRLPTDHEWSCAVGIGKLEDANQPPSTKHNQIKVFPWGRNYSAPNGAGNYFGQETTGFDLNVQKNRKSIEGYNDGFVQTSPAGSFNVNNYGLFDMGGNAWEWCLDLFLITGDEHTTRGGSFTTIYPSAASSFRNRNSNRRFDLCIRCVLAESTTKPTPEKPATLKPLVGAMNTAMGIASATKDKPFENRLGMRFVPVPITGGPSDGQLVLFSIWETRVEDYAAFIKKNRDQGFQETPFKQGDDHPAVNVSWKDAVAFCEWLTEVERKKGKLSKDERYRLPTDHEWSCAVGIGREEDADQPPSAKQDRIKTYPWGEGFPPTKGSGNYYGQETKRNPISYDLTRPQIEGYDDGFDRTAPVGSFEENKYGLYDMGGNVWECCQEWYSSKEEKRVLRGGSWELGGGTLLRSSHRRTDTPTSRYRHNGFRCVISR